MSRKASAQDQARIPVGAMAAQAHREGDLVKAEELYRVLLKEHAENPDLLAAIGQVCVDQAKYEEAAEFLKKTVEIRPSDAKSLYNLGLAYQQMKENELAVANYERALALAPGLPSGHNNIAGIYFHRGEYSKAIEHLEKAIEIEEKPYNALSNLALTYAEIGRVDEALDALRRAIAINPKLHKAHSNLLFNLHYHLNDSAEIFEAHKEWAQLHEAPLASERAPHENERSSDRPLRIGYVSPDFKLHSVAYFFVPILKAHDRQRVEVFCYSDVEKPDELTQHLRSLAHHWRDVARMSDKALTEQIRNDRIDILVDLAGHTAENRLQVFARKPAPIQINYLGYPDTTGLEAMDYRLTDEVADPPGSTEHLHTETLIRLPDTFLCYQPPTNTPEVAELPAVQNGYITFGCFNTLPKVTPEVIALWCRLLDRVPNSRILLKARGLKDASTRERTLQQFLAHGIAPERVELLGVVPGMLAHLDLYNRIDIALDCFPYNGTTTTCEALWMGVPIVALEGRIHLSRVSASILGTCGLTELVAADQEQYLNLAAGLANDLPRLRTLRNGLRERLRGSPLMDATRFVNALEDQYHRIWRRYCQGEAPGATEAATPPHTQAPIACADGDTLELTTRDGIVIRTEPSLDDNETFALMTFGSWYEPDAAMLRRLVRPGMSVVDLEAGFGGFSLLAGRLAGPSGHVWAVNRDADKTALLEQSIDRNGFGNIDVLPGAEPQLSLDAVAAAADITAVDLLRVPSLDALETALGQGSHWLSQESPLVVITPQSNASPDHPVLRHLQDLGYAFYQGVPALAALAPWQPANDGDVLGAIYCCKQDRATQLAEAGVLIQDTAADPAVVPSNNWRDYIGTLPYAVPHMDAWEQLAATHLGWPDYQQTLALHAASRRDTLPTPTRYALLANAFGIISGLMDTAPSLPRLMTAARIAADLGLRNTARDVTKVLVDLFSSDQPLELNEPFLPPHPRYDGLDPGGRMGEWCLAAVLEQYEQCRRISAYHSDAQDLERLNFFPTLGFASDEMERRRQLVDLRLNKAARTAAEPSQHSIQTPAPHQMTSTKPKVAILYHLARTGGTLISKCLGCIEGNVLLSEIHPLLSVKSPIEQAQQWFHLLDENDLNAFSKKEQQDYPAAIELIGNKCQSSGKKLILRDWSHIDFTAVPFVSHPSYQLTQTEILKDRFSIKQLATVRHPLDSYLSISRLAVVQGHLTLESYLKGCHEFALKAREIGFVRYEDFCESPKAVLKHICEHLGVNYNDNFVNDYSEYKKITGEVTGGRSTTDIKVPKRQPVSEELLRKFESNDDYWATLDILGYKHPR